LCNRREGVGKGGRGGPLLFESHEKIFSEKFGDFEGQAKEPHTEPVGAVGECLPTKKLRGAVGCLTDALRTTLVIWGG